MKHYPASAAVLPAATAGMAAVVFAADAFTPPECVVSGLYVVVVLMAGRFCRARGLWLVAAGCSALTMLAQFLAHQIVFGRTQTSLIGTFNSAVSVLAIGLSTYLILRGKSTELALQRAQTDLAHISRVTTLGELTAAIGHEVNQPIAAVVTNASACMRWLALDIPDLEQARTAAARIVRDGTRAADIIGRIKQVFSKSIPQRQPVDINQLLRETIELLNSQATRHLISLQTDLATDLPAVMADRVQLQQVVVNLVANGIDAVNEGAEGVREIVVRSRCSDAGQVVVSVSDTGVGLASPKPDQLFEAFFTTKQQGTGMGLSISRSIIDAHQGRLWAAPNTPRGAVFAFSVPVEG